MKALVKTCMVAMVIVGVAGIFAGTAVAAPAEGVAVMDQYRPEPTAHLEAIQIPIQIHAQLPVEVIECSSCPETAAAGPEPAASDGDGPVLSRIPDDLTVTPGTPDNPDKPDTPDTPDNPDTPATPETPETPDEPETPPLTEEEHPVTSSKLPNTGTRILFLALAALALIGAAPFAGMWIDSRLNKK